MTATSRKLQCEALEARDVPAAWYTVTLDSPAQGEPGDSDLTVTSGGLVSATHVWAESPAAAVRQAVSGSVVVGSHTHEFRPDTVAVSTADQTPFVLVPVGGGYEVRLEDLAATPGVSDWDYDDHAWFITVEETDEFTQQAVVQAVLGELNAFFDAGGTERLLRFIGSINPNNINGSQSFVFVDDGLNGISSTTFEYHISQDRLSRHVVLTCGLLNGQVLSHHTVGYANYASTWPHHGFGGDAGVRAVEIIHQQRLAEARQNRDNHIRAVINANPNWTQAQKDAIIDAMLKLVHAAEKLPSQGFFPPGPLGSCNEWQQAFMEANMQLIVQLERAGLVRVDTVAWESIGTIGNIFGAAHVAIRITLPDGTVFYLDDGNWGNLDHTFMENEVPGHFVPLPISTPPRTPWVPK